MNKRIYPTIGQANLLYLVAVTAIIAGSSLLVKILGVYGNAWVNEYIYILFPVLLLAGIRSWPLETVYRYRGTSVKNGFLSIFSGVGIWLFSAYLSRIINNILAKLGTFSVDAKASGSTPVQGVLMLIGLVVLAPICEETFFRGFLQRAYESYSKRYAFVIAALLFGIFHISNGISQVLPAFAIGLVLGYLVKRSGSLASSMLAHSAANISSVILGGAMGLTVLGKIPLWLHFVGFAGLGSAILLVRFVSNTSLDEKAPEDMQKPEKHIIRNAILLAASLVILLGEGGIEIVYRLGRL